MAIYILPASKVSVDVTNQMLAEMVQQALHKQLGIQKYQKIACDEKDNIYLDLSTEVWQNNPEVACLIRAISYLRGMY